jgi:hypothetical protein
MDYPSEPKIPRELMDGYLFALGRTGVFGEMCRYAEQRARERKEFGKADSFRAIAEQFADVIAGTR